MNKQVSKIVGIGGFAESKAMMMPVMKAAQKALSVGDYTVFTFAEAVKNPGAVTKATDKAVLITHSSGIVAAGRDISPVAVIAYNAPESENIRTLISSVFRKSTRHAQQLINSDNHISSRNTLMGGILELASHPVINTSQLNKISQFRASRYLSGLKDAHPAMTVRNVVFSEDELFKPTESAQNFAKEHGVEVVLLDGSHDEILFNSEAVVSGLKDLRFN